MILPIGDAYRPDKVPFVNYALIAANIFIFIFLQIHDFSSEEAQRAYFSKWAFTPALFHSEPLEFLPTVLYSMFMHGSIMHVLMNMLFLWITGDNVEGRLGHIGYIFFYLFAGVAACMAQYVWNVTEEMPMLGASGAISGVIGAYFILCAKNKIRIFYWIWFYVGVFLVPARLVIGFWVLQQVLLALFVTIGGENLIAVWAHLGGLVFGLGISFLLVRIKMVTPQEILGEYAPFRRSPTSFFTRRQRMVYNVEDSPYAKYSRERNLFGPEPAVQQADGAQIPSQAPPQPAIVDQQAAFAVVAVKPWKANYEKVVDAVATTLGQPFSAVSQRLKNEPGVLADSLGAERANALVEKLRELGTTAIALAEADILKLPPTYSADNIVAHPGGFMLYSGGRGLSKRYADVFLIICGLVGEPAARRVVGDVYLFEPWARFRFVENNASPYATFNSIRLSVSRLMHSASSLPVNRGVRVLVDGGDWTPVVFESIEEFDRYSYWLVQVVNGKNKKSY